MKTRTAKRLIAFILSLTMAAAAVSCGNIDDSSANAKDVDPGASQTQQTSGTSKAPSSPEAPEPIVTETEFEASEGELDEQFLANASDFTVKLLQNAVSDDLREGKNAMISSESVMLALGMTANGAGGKTLEEFETLLGGGMKLEDINRNLNLLISDAKNEQRVKFGIANSIWVREGERITMEKSFADICRRRYDAESFVAPFDDATLGKLNSWVSDNTNGMINKIKEEFSQDDVALLVNCIAFEGAWRDQYETPQITENATFHSAKDGDQTCTMLHSVEKYYLADDKAEGFMKYYMGGRYAFAALLPNEGISTADYISSLTGEGLRKTLSERSTDYDVFAQLPEFSFDWDASLVTSLKAMGLNEAFMESADLTNMAKTATGELFISDVVHKTHIELDRNGTKAAAVTMVVEQDNAMGVIEESKVKRIVLDRPFVMMIVDTKTDLPVFIGAVNTLEQ